MLRYVQVGAAEQMVIVDVDLSILKVSSGFTRSLLVVLNDVRRTRERHTEFDEIS